MLVRLGAAQALQEPSGEVVQTPQLSQCADSPTTSRMVLSSKAIGPVETLVSAHEADAREAPVTGVGSVVRQLHTGHQQALQQAARGPQAEVSLRPDMQQEWRLLHMTTAQRLAAAVQQGTALQPAVQVVQQVTQQQRAALQPAVQAG